MKGITRLLVLLLNACGLEVAVRDDTPRLPPASKTEVSWPSPTTRERRHGRSRLWARWGIAILVAASVLFSLLGLGFLAFVSSCIAMLMITGRLVTNFRIFSRRIFGVSVASWLLILFGFTVFLILFANVSGLVEGTEDWLEDFIWDEFGSWAEWFGAVGNFATLVASAAALWYVLRQIAIDQTGIIQSTQQQLKATLVDPEGRILLIDQNRRDALAQVRAVLANPLFGKNGTAALLVSLSTSGYLTKCLRDWGYLRAAYDPRNGKLIEDWKDGLCPVPLHELKAKGRGYFEGYDFSDSVLTGAMLGQISFRNGLFANADLTGATLIGADLRGGNFEGAILVGVRFATGSKAEEASPRQSEPADYDTGKGTGAIVKDAVFWRATMDPEIFYYLWNNGSSKTRTSLKTATVVR